MPHLFVQDLTVIDCSILDPQRGLIGASWSVDVELIGDLDHQSMVFDFAKVKKTIKQLIDQHVDHKLVIPTNYQGTQQKKTDKALHISFTDEHGEVIQHSSSNCAVCLIKAKEITPQTVITYLTSLLKQALPDNVQELKLTLRPEEDYAFFYHYSHGLKKHDGNCQRIAHGHRSRIQIWENHKRSRTWEQYIADLWSDIYLGTQEDITEQSDERIRFEYTTEQGDFMIELPKHRVHVMPYDTTVECIAQYLAEYLKQKQPGSHIKIQAFEGIKKGAFAEID